MSSSIEKGASEAEVKSKVVDQGEKGDKVESEKVSSPTATFTTADWQSAATKKDGKSDTVATTLPVVELEVADKSASKSVEKPAPAAILASDASAEDKIKAVEALGRAGHTSVEIVDKDGSKRSMIIELEKAGARTLVHLYALDEQGKDRVVLRGIKNADGSYQNQQTEAGDKVGSYGTWWSKNMGDRSYFSEVQTAKVEPAKSGDVNLFPNKRSEIAPAAETPRVSLPEVKVETVLDNKPQKEVTEQYQQVAVIPADRAIPQPADAQPFYPQTDAQTLVTEDLNKQSRDIVVPFKERVPERVVSDEERLNQLFDGIAQKANRARRLTQIDDGTVYFRAGMAIDADGSPRARQIDPYGQTETSLRYKNGASVNAEKVNYFVLPLGQYQQFGVRKGDIAAVRYGDEVRFAVFADAGPSHKLGEGSMALAASLGINPNPRSGGTHRPEVEYIVFPGSGNGRPLHNGAHQDLGRHYLGKAYRRTRD
jgi:hypothetical protein